MVDGHVEMNIESTIIFRNLIYPPSPLHPKVNGRIIKKQLHVAVPHVRPSTCQAQIISRKKENERIKSEVRAGADRVLLKR